MKQADIMVSKGACTAMCGQEPVGLRGVAGLGGGKKNETGYRADKYQELNEMSQLIHQLNEIPSISLWVDIPQIN